MLQEPGRFAAAVSSGAALETRDVNPLDGGMDSAFGVEHFGQPVQPGIRHTAHGQMGIHSPLSGRQTRAGDHIKESCLAGELDPDDPDLHVCLPNTNRGSDDPEYISIRRD